MSHPQEASLLARAIAGDGLAYRQLIEPHLPLLYRIAGRHAADRALADDIVQEVLIIAYQKLRRFQPQASFKAYLAGIVVKKSHSIHRSAFRRRRREAMSQTLSEPEPDPAHCYEAKLMAAQLRAAIASLPAKQRQALLLRLDVNLSHAEIAHALSSSEASVRVLIHKATKRIAQMLATTEQEESYVPITKPIRTLAR